MFVTPGGFSKVGTGVGIVVAGVGSESSNEAKGNGVSVTVAVAVGVGVSVGDGVAVAVLVGFARVGMGVKVAGSARLGNEWTLLSVGATEETAATCTTSAVTVAVGAASVPVSSGKQAARSPSRSNNSRRARPGPAAFPILHFFTPGIILR
jgi:hypothetical protein